jgi:hypothetical protein
MSKKKLCKDCNQTKPISEFQQRTFWTCKRKLKRGTTIKQRCKECERARLRKRYAEDEEYKERKKQHAIDRYNSIDRDEALARKKTFYNENQGRLLKEKRDKYKQIPDEMRKRNRDNYDKHRKKRAAAKREERKKNPEETKAIAKKAYLKNRDKILEKDKIYKKKNRSRYNKRTAERYNTDLHFNLRSKLKNRVNHVFRYGVKKSESTMELLGTDDLDVVWQHFEIMWMDTYGTQLPKDEFFNGNIHIDHIVPCSSFDLTDTEQQKKCFHYTNLELLWAIDNLRKGDSLTE